MPTRKRLPLGVVAASILALGMSWSPAPVDAEPVAEANGSAATGPALSEAEATAIALNDIEQIGDQVTVSNLRHDATFGKDGLLFVPTRGTEPWHWSLENVTVGGSPVALAADAIPAAETSRVLYDRGAITEQYLVKSYSLEQQFVVHAPLGEGDLTITGAVNSAGLFSANDTEWHWGEVKLGDVTVYDANGVELDAWMNVQPYGTTITVSSSALATAAYPILIDPEIGTNDFRISDMQGTGVAGFHARHVDIAYNSTNNEYLVVWHGADVTTNVFDIYAQRINGSTGAEVGTNDFRISNFGNGAPATDDAFEPEVAWNSTNNEYLVVWEGRRGGDREIFGQFLSNTGTEVGTDDFAISDMGTGGATPTNFIGISAAVAYNSTDNTFLVTWQGDDDVGTLADNETEVFGQLVDAATRTVTGSNDFQISFMAGANGNASFDALDFTAVAYNSTNNQFLVTWSADDNSGSLVDGEFEVYGQRLNATSGAAVGTRIRVSDVGTDGDTSPRGTHASVTWNSANNEYLVVYAADDTGTGGEYEIWGQRINGATGAQLGTNDFRISDLGPANDPNFDQQNPKVAYNSTANEYFVTWWGDSSTNNDNEIWGQRVSNTGTLTGSVEQLSQVGSGAASPANFRGEFPDIAYSSVAGQILVAWNGDDNVGGLVDDEIEVFGQRWAPPNTAPTITAAAAVAVTQGQTNTGATIATVSDVEDANGTLTVTATVVPTGINITNITNTNGTVTADVSATAAATPGANNVTLQVEDSGTATNTDTLVVNVTNDVDPTITAGAAVSVTQGQTNTGATVGTVTDPEDANGSLTVTSTSASTGLSATNITNTNGTITADISATAGAPPGAGSITFQVEDSLGQTSTDTLTVNVIDDANPTITAGAAVSVTQAQTNTGATVATVSDVVDADGSLTVTSTAASPGLSVNNITNTNGTVTADISATAGATPGPGSITFQVQDSLGQTSTDTLTVNIVDDTNPMITAGAQVNVDQGSNVTGATIATVNDTEDADGTLTVTATSVPAGITITNIVNTNGTITADVAASGAATPGANSVTLQVEDSLTQTATDTLTVAVNVPGNTTPTIIAGAAVNVVVGTPVTGATIASVSDPEDADGSLVVTATNVPTGITVSNIANTGGTVTADVSATGAATPGANLVELTVTDSGALQNTTNITVNVSATANTAPSITAATGVSAAQSAAPANTTIATVSDAEDADGSLTVTVVSAPPGINVTNIVNTGGTVTADVEATGTAATGANIVALQVADSGSFTSTALLTINVTTGGSSSGGGGDKDDDDEKCSTGADSSPWIVLLGAMALALVTLRRRRSA